MTLWITLAAVAAIGGIGAATVVWLADLRPRPSRGREELARGLERTDLALLSGGPARTADALVVDLVERGMVRATGGVLTVTDEVDRLLDTP